MDKGKVVSLDQIEIEVLWSLDEEGKRYFANLFNIVIIIARCLRNVCLLYWCQLVKKRLMLIRKYSNTKLLSHIMKLWERAAGIRIWRQVEVEEK